MSIRFTRIGCALVILLAFAGQAAEVMLGRDNVWPLGAALWCGMYWLERERAAQLYGELQELTKLLRKEDSR